MNSVKGLEIASKEQEIERLQQEREQLTQTIMEHPMQYGEAAAEVEPKREQMEDNKGSEDSDTN